MSSICSWRSSKPSTWAGPETWKQFSSRIFILDTVRQPGWAQPGRVEVRRRHRPPRAVDNRARVSDSLARSSALRPAPRRRSAASFANVRLFVAGQALSNTGSFSQLVALSLLVLDLSDSGFALGATMSVQAIPMLLVGP